MADPGFEQRELEKNKCLNEALIAGTKTAAYWLLGTASAVGIANQYWPAFRNALGVSGKTVCGGGVFYTMHATHPVQHSLCKTLSATHSLNTLSQLGVDHISSLWHVFPADRAHDGRVCP